jgi:hypothetical protein
LLIGDSFAGHLWPGLSAIGPRYEPQEASRAGCKPLIPTGNGNECQRFFLKIIKDHRANPPSMMLIAGRWLAGDLPGLTRTLSDPGTRALHPVLFGPVPEYEADLPLLLVAADQRADPDFANRHRKVGTAKLDSDMADLARRLDVPYISPYKALCPNDHCLVWADGRVPMAFDDGHLTPQGSVKVMQLLAPALDAAMTKLRR